MIFWRVLLSSLLALEALSAQRIVGPLFYRGENLGEVWFVPGAEEASLELSTESLRPHLENTLDPEAYEALVDSITKKPTVTAGEIRKHQVWISFDENSLSLKLHIPEEIQRKREFHLRSSNLPNREAIGPENFSGYLNLTGNQTFIYPTTASRQPFSGDAAFVTNFYGTALETGAYYTENIDQEWRRADTKITKDFESYLVRFSAGDVPVLATSFQNSRALGGISFSRQYSIQPYLNTKPLNRTAFELKRNSAVEVYVNQAFVQRLNLTAGKVELSDFPLFSGMNQVDLKIIDDTGNVEWINLNMLYDVQLLGDNIQEFAYQIGAPSEQFRSDRRYEDRNITFSGYHRFGVTDRWTVGANAQTDRRVLQTGIESANLTNLGLFSLELSHANFSGSLEGAAGRLRFKSLEYKRGADKTLRGTAEISYRTPWFQGIGDALTRNNFSFTYDLSLSRPISAYTSLAIGGRFEENRYDGFDRKSARLNLVSEIARAWRVSFNYGVSRESKIDHSFQVVLNWVQEAGKYFASSSYEYPTRTLRVEGTRNGSSVLDDIRATAGLQNSPVASQADLLLDYNHEKASVRVNHVSTQSREEPGIRQRSHSTGLSLATGIAWAGSNVAWTRPITDSFALISASPSIRDFKIPVNPNGNVAEANVNRIGPAVVPTLTSYNTSPIFLDSSKLPLGYSIGAESYFVRPTYRSGIGIQLRNASTITVTGTIWKNEKDPLSLVTGTVMDSNSRQARSTFFTNKEGYYLIEGLEAGDYQIQIDQGDYAPIPFKIEPESHGFIALPKIELKRGNP